MRPPIDQAFTAKLAALRARQRQQLGLAPGRRLLLPTGTALGIDVASGQTISLSAADGRSVYSPGATGVGKTTVIDRDIVALMQQGHGCMVIDPHGDLISSVLHQVPPHREGDVVLLDPRDIAFPYALNPFDCDEPGNELHVTRTVDRAVELVKKLTVSTTGVRGWGAIVQNLTRISALTLLPARASLFELPLLLEDPELRTVLLGGVRDNLAVRFFWEHRFPKIPASKRTEYTESTVNKIFEYLTRPLLLNIMGQRQKTVHMRELMDRGAIVLLPLPIGEIGSDTAKVLGGTALSEVFAAALSRSDIPESERRPFRIYADEVQTFATDDLAELLVSVRKYKVSMWLANQFLEQLPEQTRAAVLNVAHLLTFRVSPQDAVALAGLYNNTPPPGDYELKLATTPYRDGTQRPLKRVTWDFDGERDIRVEDQLYEWQRGPQRTFADMLAERANELANLPPYHARVRLWIDNRLVEYQLQTLPSDLPQRIAPRTIERLAGIIARSRETFCRPRADVEAELKTRLEQGAAWWRAHGGYDDGRWLLAQGTSMPSPSDSAALAAADMPLLLPAAATGRRVRRRQLDALEQD